MPRINRIRRVRISFSSPCDRALLSSALSLHSRTSALISRRLPEIASVLAAFSAAVMVWAIERSCSILVCGNACSFELSAAIDISANGFGSSVQMMSATCSFKASRMVYVSISVSIALLYNLFSYSQESTMDHLTEALALLNLQIAQDPAKAQDSAKIADLIMVGMAELSETPQIKATTEQKGIQTKKD